MICGSLAAILGGQGSRFGLSGCRQQSYRFFSRWLKEILPSKPELIVHRCLRHADVRACLLPFSTHPLCVPAGLSLDSW